MIVIASKHYFRILFHSIFTTILSSYFYFILFYNWGNRNRESPNKLPRLYILGWSPKASTLNLQAMLSPFKTDSKSVILLLFPLPLLFVYWPLTKLIYLLFLKYIPHFGLSDSLLTLIPLAGNTSLISPPAEISLILQGAGHVPPSLLII